MILPLPSSSCIEPFLTSSRSISDLERLLFGSLVRWSTAALESMVKSRKRGRAVLSRKVDATAGGADSYVSEEVFANPCKRVEAY